MIDAQTQLAQIDGRLSGLLEHDELTQGERLEHDGLVALREKLTEPRTGRKTDAASELSDAATEPKPLPPTAWVDLATGRHLPVLQAGQQFSSKSELSVGRFIRGLATGNWKHAELERMAISETGSGGGGHYLVPEQLSTQVIDLVRAKSVLIAAGCGSVTMTSETQTIAKVDGDPTFQIKSENAEFTGSDINFAGVMLTSRVIGTIITGSRELFEDAPNVGSLIEQVLSAALAVEIDNYALDKILITPGIGTTGSVAAIAWEDIHSGVVALRVLNYEPNGYVLNPEIAGDLDILTSGDGTNAAKTWLGPPPSLDDVRRHDTTSIATSSAVIGDFRFGLFGWRTGAMIEASNVAQGAFEKHQIKVKVTQRFDFVTTRPAAFHSLTGITT
jgi:HK97 family phage major capsid protein